MLWPWGEDWGEGSEGDRAMAFIQDMSTPGSQLPVWPRPLALIPGIAPRNFPTQGLNPEAEASIPNMER